MSTGVIRLNITDAAKLRQSGLVPGVIVRVQTLDGNSVDDAIFTGVVEDPHDPRIVIGVRLNVDGVVYNVLWFEIDELWAI